MREAAGFALGLFAGAALTGGGALPTKSTAIRLPASAHCDVVTTIREDHSARSRNSTCSSALESAAIQCCPRSI